MGSFSIGRIDHVNITTPAELADDVLGWYEGCLGLKRIPKPEGTRDSGGWFQVGDVELHISVDEHNPPHEAHYALTVDDFDALVESLRAAGCHLEQARPIPGRRRVFTRDPAGNGIEILSREGAADA